MQVKIKPFSSEYAKQCADLEQYLWKEDEQGREARFDWAYTNSPVNKKPLCVIAVDENDEVLGFRGYFLNRFVAKGEGVLVAGICDTVVSPKARRQGIFQKMTNYSLPYLKENGVKMVIDLGPSWPPYHGYKKIGFEDLSPFHSKYLFGICSFLKKKLLKKDRTDWSLKEPNSCAIEGLIHHISQNVDDSIIEQVTNVSSTSRIHSTLDFNILKWRTIRPEKHYVYGYSVDELGKLHGFMMFRTADYYHFDLGLFLSDDRDAFAQLFHLFKKEYKPASVAAWDFALDKESHKLLKKIGMITIPFINKLRKNPPALIKTLLTDQEGNLDWFINGVDIRKVENWQINKMDLDSF